MAKEEVAGGSVGATHARHEPPQPPRLRPPQSSRPREVVTLRDLDGLLPAGTRLTASTTPALVATGVALLPSQLRDGTLEAAHVLRGHPQSVDAEMRIVKIYKEEIAPGPEPELLQPGRGGEVKRR